MREFLRTFGELCVTTGLVLMLFTAYMLWGTGRYVDQQQDRLSEELRRSWEAPRGTTEQVRLGGGVALIRIPRLGDDFRYVVVEGVGTDDLRKGPGHYPGTAMPGQIGNFVVSGHRTTYGGPFNRLDELRAGDEILIDTRKWRFVYKVTDSRVVAPTASEAVARVPFEPGRRPTRRLITLTTCHPEYSAAQRLIILGRLASWTPRLEAPAA